MIEPMPRATAKLSPREEECLGFIAAFTDREGSPPHQNDIADHIGSSSRGFVHRVLKSLEAKGFIRILAYERRGIELI